MTLSGPPCPHLAAIAGGFGPHYGWGTAGQADIQATWDAAVSPKMGAGVFKLPGRRALQSNGSRTTKAHMGGPPVHQKKRSCSRHQDRAHPRFISQAMRLTPVVRLRVMQSRLRRPLVVDAAWSRHDRVRPRFSLDHLTSRPLTRYERLGFLFAITIPRPHRSLPPLVPV